MKKLTWGQSHLSRLQRGHQADTPPHCLAAAQRRVSEFGKRWNPREVSELRVNPLTSALYKLEIWLQQKGCENLSIFLAFRMPSVLVSLLLL